MRKGHPGPPRFRAGWLVGVAGTAGLLLAPDVRAQTADPRFEMTWEVPADCSPQARTRGKLVVLLGKEPEQIVGISILVHAVIVRDGAEAWRVGLAITQHGEKRWRRLMARSCEELGDAVALLVALAIDPDVRTRLGAGPPHESSPQQSGGPRAAAPLPARAATPASVPVQAPSVVPNTRSARRLRWDGFVGVGPVVELGVLPHPGYGVAAVSGADVEQLRVELGATYATSARSDQDVHFDFGAVALRACWLVPLGSAARLGPCAMAELGRLWADGRAGVGQGHADWGSARAGANVCVRPLRPLELALAANVGLPFEQTTFIARGAPEHQPAPVVGSGRVLIEAHFP